MLVGSITPLFSHILCHIGTLSLHLVSYRDSARTVTHAQHVSHPRTHGALRTPSPLRNTWRTAYAVTPAQHMAHKVRLSPISNPPTPCCINVTHGPPGGPTAPPCICRRPPSTARRPREPYTRIAGNYPTANWCGNYATLAAPRPFTCCANMAGQRGLTIAFFSCKGLRVGGERSGPDVAKTGRALATTHSTTLVVLYKSENRPWTPRTSPLPCAPCSSTAAT